MLSPSFGHLTLEVNSYNRDHERMYYPGDSIHAKVSYTLFQRYPVEGIWIDLVGQEHTDLINRGSNMSAEVKDDDIFIFNGRCISRGTREMRKSYRIRFQLPKNIPSTFVNEKGWVKYFIRVTMYLTPNLVTKCQKEIKVFSPVDFNSLESSFMQPVTLFVNKEMKTLFCLSIQSINMDVHFPKRAFTLGEQTKIGVDVYNRSGKDIKRIELRLGQTIITKSSPHENCICHKDEEVLAIREVEGLPVALYNKQHYEFAIELPQSVQIPNFCRCKLFSHSGWIKVVAFYGNSKIAKLTPVVIGHVSLEPAANNQDWSHRQLQDEAASHHPPSVISSPSSDYHIPLRQTTSTSPTIPTSSPAEDLPPSYDAVCRQPNLLRRYNSNNNRDDCPSPSYHTTVSSLSPQRSLSPFTCLDLPLVYSNSPPYPLETSDLFPMPVPNIGKPAATHLQMSSDGYVNPLPPYPDEGSCEPPTEAPKRTLPISCLFFTPGNAQEEPSVENVAPVDRNS